MQKDNRKTISHIEAKFVLAIFTIAVLLFIFYPLLPKKEPPTRSQLTAISGVIQSFSCSGGRSICRVIIKDVHGKVYDIGGRYQLELIKRELYEGEHISVLIQPDVESYVLWECKKGDRVILSYDDVLLRYNDTSIAPRVYTLLFSLVLMIVIFAACAVVIKIFDIKTRE